MTPDFNEENLQIYQKPRAYNLSKTSTMKNKKLNSRFYLTQANQSFSDHLTSTFPFQFLTFFFRSTLRVHNKLDLSLFLNPYKKKMGFCIKPREREMNVLEIKPCSFSKNPFLKKKNLGKLG